nr:probable E3 ubiquitin-protein ligase RHB1A [Tanacetum cinerariifolium]
MGGCCCSSNRVDWNHSSQLYHHPVVSEEHQLLSSSNGAASTFPVGLLVDTNLDTSIPDTYRHPPAPLPYDSNVGNPQCPEVIGEIKDNISGENVASEAKESDCKGKTSFELSATEDEMEVNFPIDD